MMFALLISFLLSLLLTVSTSILPLCSIDSINDGKWYDWNRPLQPKVNLSDILPRFFYSKVNEALNFSQIWLPNSCSYHRFTNNTLDECLAFIRQQPSTAEQQQAPKKFHIVFVGDSGTRSVFCGLTRLISGSEFSGGCQNEVCGYNHRGPISYRQVHQIHHVDFTVSLRMTFIYFKSMLEPIAESTLHNALALKPQVLVLNTGAWDFDSLARQHAAAKKNATSIADYEYCQDPESEKISQARISSPVKHIFQVITKQAAENHVRLIYRTNHHNNRFGVHCADDQIIEYLRNLKPSWTIWSNREISLDVWQEQNYDGFHFDRTRVHTPEHSAVHMKFFHDKKWIYPGQLEVQLSQSLLHTIFHDDCVQHFYDRETKAAEAVGAAAATVVDMSN